MNPRFEIFIICSRLELVSLFHFFKCLANFFIKCFSDLYLCSWCVFQAIASAYLCFYIDAFCVCSQCNLSDSLCILSVCLAFNCHLQPHPLSLIHCHGAAATLTFLHGAALALTFFHGVVATLTFLCFPSNQSTSLRILRRARQIFWLSIVLNCRLRPKIVAFFGQQLEAKIRSVLEHRDYQVAWHTSTVNPETCFWLAQFHPNVADTIVIRIFLSRHDSQMIMEIQSLVQRCFK